MQKDNIFKIMNKEELLKFERYAGGHDEHMKNLVKGAKVIAHWNEEDYQGQVATCVLLPDETYMIYNDYYGSCSGCDAWEDAEDEEILKMCQDLIYSSKIFNTLEEVQEFLSQKEFDDYSWEDSSKELLEEIKLHKIK